MHTNLKKEILANAEKHNKAQEKTDILAILQEADKALLVGKHIIAHNCIQLAIAELTEKEKEPK